MYIAILQTYYELYAIGKTRREAEENIVKAYLNCMPVDRQIENPTFETLRWEIGIGVYYIDPKKGYVMEG